MQRQKVGVIGWLFFFDDEYALTTAACDVSEAKLTAFKAAHPGVTVFKDYREMAEKAGLDAVVISTPNWFHREMAEHFLERGIHVFLEKPMGVNREEIDSLVRCAKRSGKILAIDFELRVSPSTLRVKEIIDAGEIGTLNGIEFIHHRGAWLASKNGVWRTDPKLSGGTFFMEICHEVDIFRHLMGEITHVQSFKHANLLPQYKDGMPDNVYTHVWFEGGQMGTIISTHTSSADDAPAERYNDMGHDMQFIITGTDGCIRMECIRSQLLICRYQEYHPDAETGKRVVFKRLEDYSSVKAFAHDIVANHSAFLKSCALGEPFHQDAEDAWKTHVVCLAAEKSAVENFQRIAIDYSALSARHT